MNNDPFEFSTLIRPIYSRIDRLENLVFPEKLKKLEQLSSKWLQGTSEPRRPDPERITRVLNTILAGQSAADACRAFVNPHRMFLDVVEYCTRSSAEVGEILPQLMSAESIHWLQTAVKTQRSTRLLERLSFLYLLTLDQPGLPNSEIIAGEQIEQLWKQQSEHHLSTRGMIWKHHAAVIFRRENIASFCKKAHQETTAPQIIDYFHLPPDSPLAKNLASLLPVYRLKHLEFEQIDETLFTRIREVRKNYYRKRTIGSLAVQIMTDRVLAERQAKWPRPWAEQIARLACHPRGQERSPWWNWADEKQIRCAKKGVATLNLELFLDILKRQYMQKPYQWKSREELLRSLLEHDNIQDACLLLTEPSQRQISKDLINSLAPITVLDSLHNLIFVETFTGFCILEGANDTPIRAWASRSSCPLAELLDKPNAKISRLKINNSRHDIKQVHNGGWPQRFKYDIEEKFRYRWPD